MDYKSGSGYFIADMKEENGFILNCRCEMIDNLIVYIKNLPHLFSFVLKGLSKHGSGLQLA